MQSPREVTRERQLFEAFVAGDDAAFAALFQRYHDRLVRDACRFVPADLAEDLVQDVFAGLWIHRARWTIRTTVRKYLHSAVRNRARDLIARSKTEQRANDGYRHAMYQRHVIGPEDALLTQELENAIKCGLDTCPARCRAALLLLEDHPLYADIARHLGVKPGTVQVLIKRGRRRLRAYLREQGWEEIVGSPFPFPVRPHMRHGVNLDNTHRTLHTDFDLTG
jgi:RNA polymerase sigma-70 factor (ECF subfamily)